MILRILVFLLWYGVIWIYHCFDIQRPLLTNDVFVAFELQWYKTFISYVHIFVNLIMQNIIFEETWSICVSIKNIISTKPDFSIICWKWFVLFVGSSIFSSIISFNIWCHLHLLSLLSMANPSSVQAMSSKWCVI